jgi:Ca-activated chloride channel homolog
MIRLGAQMQLVHTLKVHTLKIPFITLLAVGLLAGCSSSSTNSSGGGSDNSADLSKVKKVDPMTSSEVDADSTGSSDISGGASGAGTRKGSMDLSRNFYFVFDGSGSMKDKPRASDQGDHDVSSKIVGAKWAVNEFMKNVPKNVNLGLFVFDAHGEREVLPLGPNNRQKFLDDINAVQAKGGTPLGDAVGKGALALAKQYKKQLGYGEYKLIVITDGEADDRIENGITKAMKYNIPIYTIGFGIGPTHSLRKYSISYRSADSAKQVESALEEATAELDVFDAPSFKKKN